MGFVRIDNPNIKDCGDFIDIIPVIGHHMGSIRENNKKDTLIQQHKLSMTANQTEFEKDRQFLEVLYRDYTSIYYVDFSKNIAEPLKIDRIANAAKFIDSPSKHITLNYNDTIKQYSETYITKEHSKRFCDLLNADYLRQGLCYKERFSFRYRSLPNILGQQYFEAQIVRISETDFDNRILIGFKHIDDIVASEQKRQHELETALAETKLSNEIVSALGKIYYAIFRIDLVNDFYEEISSESEIHHLTGKIGRASTEMIELCDTFVAPEYHDKVLEFFDLSTLADRLHDEETLATEYLAKDGNWHTARFIVKKRDNNGNVTHILYATRLISDAKRREKNWISIAEEANKANLAKTEFISQIAHDILTPMNAILGFETLAEQHINEPKTVEYNLKKIKSSGDFLMELVNEVLDITQIENGQLRINSQPVNIPKLLDDFPPMLKQLQGDKKLNIICNQHDLYQKTLLVDPLRLKQIYTNILSNAIKYTPDGGSVTFEIYEELFLNNKYINLIAVISDTGIGMSQEYINHMYSKFSRATDSRINKVGGYGLGLSIVKELVDLMNGRINVTSKEGHGTTFKIIIPLECCAENYKALQDISDTSAHNTCKGMHLLVAEDNTLNYEVISELLAMYGITCDHAEDGSVCVEMFRESSIHTYDAILMDMQMPVMDGLQATSAIRNLNKPGAHSIPIIAMTANAFKDDIQRCLDAGMNMHMSKPVNMEKLLKALAKFKGEVIVDC